MTPPIESQMTHLIQIFFGQTLKDHLHLKFVQPGGDFQPPPAHPINHLFILWDQNFAFIVKKAARGEPGVMLLLL